MQNNLQKDLLAQPMPAPKPGKSGIIKASLLMIFCLAALGCAWFWLTRTPESKEELREQAANFVNEAAEGTPLAGIGNILRDSPPPPPVIALPEEPGTMAGKTITQSLAAENEQSLQNAANAPQSDAAPVLAQDKTIAPIYIEELAEWFAKRYKPGSKSLDASAQGLNHFGGVTIANQIKGGRPGLIRYAFQPNMLRGLYDAYIDKFMTDLNQAAREQGFSASQNKQFHMALAGKAVLWATALEGVLAVPDLKKSLQDIETTGQQAVDVNMELANAVFAFDELREQKAASTQLEAAQLRVSGLAARYRRSSEEYSRAQRALVAQIRKNSGQSLDNETLLFIAGWVERRINSDSNARNSLTVCASLLRDFSRRCAQTVSQPAENN